MRLGARSLKFAVMIAGALALGACAKNAADDGMGALGSAPAGSIQEFNASVGDRVFFESDSSQLTPQGTATLDKQASWLSRYQQYSILVEGHADERGTREYNFALGAQRAQAARDYLTSRGVAASRLRTTSYGKERPVAVCNDISCWSQNRRAVTVLGGGASS
ncbi:peptidoglycan-associated lipoprotein Pal [Terrarubrum flagellatum]|uniref:peptidoglycan-associated lipoprotein Pal n=1 Tax=Terrirubrum flagellatum TaxID=2895980 RepID=UPI0031452B17